MSEIEFDDSQETGNWLHAEAYAEEERGMLPSVQRPETLDEETPPEDGHEDGSRSRTSLGD
jgi:predicted metal-binding protein